MDNFSKPDLATPLNSQGDYGNAMGGFQLDRSLSRKVKSRKDLSQPKGKPPQRVGHPSVNSMERYFGSFSLESKRHVWDLLKKHPLFGDSNLSRSNRIENNTRQVLTNDPLKVLINGGFTVYEHPENHESELQRSKNLPK